MSEIILVIGPPGGGKTTLVDTYVKQGYHRLNRDLIGGKLSTPDAKLYQILRQKYKEGVHNFVLDNTYADKASRAIVIGVARELGLSVHVKWLQTTREQAQLFAARRQVLRYGKLLHAHQYKKYSSDPNMFPPIAQFGYWKRHEEPTLEEGFLSIEKIDIKTSFGSEYVNKAIILDLDGTLRTTKSGDIYPKKRADVQILPNRKNILRKYEGEYILLGATNQSGISCHQDDKERYVSEEDVQECIDETVRQLGLDIDCLYAPDKAGVPTSYWRKPMPGMGVVFIEKYKLNPSECIMVGDMATDKTFAERCGFQFQWAHEFFVL